MFVYIFLKFIHISQYIISNNHNIGVFVVYFNQEYYIIGTRYDNEKNMHCYCYRQLLKYLQKKPEEDSFEKDCYMYMNIVSVQGKIY